MINNRQIDHSNSPENYSLRENHISNSYLKVIIFLLTTTLITGLIYSFVARLIFDRNFKINPNPDRNNEEKINNSLNNVSNDNIDKIVLKTTAEDSFVYIPKDAIIGKGTFELSPFNIESQEPLGYVSKGPSVILRLLEWDREFKLLKPFQISMRYGDLEHFNMGKLAIFYFDEKKDVWVQLKTIVDQNEKIATTYDAINLGEYRLFGPLICEDFPGEPYDDKYGTHGAPYITDFSKPEKRLFDIRGDVDWIHFPTKKGKNYTIKTINLAPGVDTILSATDDNQPEIVNERKFPEEPGSQINYQNKFENDWYLWVNVKPSAKSIVGCKATYELKITEQ